MRKVVHFAVIVVLALPMAAGFVWHLITESFDAGQEHADEVMSRLVGWIQRG